ncbi:uncharacterized protein LOC134846462 isoform X2 [Symsagittifera roscoffensis]|uniref:uncharacterized protein LOC134846462 isoform X2 n=1 Tax=Symsagittifera roscoffensis TaxID=84072 RepID=UPI00307B491F
MSVLDDRIRQYSGSIHRKTSSSTQKSKSKVNLMALGGDPRIYGVHSRRDALVMIPEVLNPNTVSRLMEVNNFTGDKIVSILEERLRYNLQLKLTLNLDANVEILAEFLGDRWDEYYNLLVPLFCIALNAKGIHMRKGFFRVFAEELLTNESVLFNFSELLRTSIKLRNMLVILNMNAFDGQFSREGSEKLTSFIRLIHSFTAT